MTKSQKKTLQPLFREVCFARDGYKCVRCGREDTLAPSHIYPKGHYRRLEFDPDNVVTFCFYHHIMWWHKNPIEAHEWLETTIDKKRLSNLKMRANTIDKTPIDYKLLVVELKHLLAKYTKIRYN